VQFCLSCQCRMSFRNREARVARRVGACLNFRKILVSYKYRKRKRRVTHSSVACICLFCTHNPKKAMKVTHILLVLVWFFCIYAPTSFCTNVTYDHRALVIDGKRRVLVSGSIHYPRSTPEVLFITLFLCLSNVTCTLFFSHVYELWS